MDLIKELNKETLAKESANVQIGDTIRVHVKVKEGSRERIQVFEGTVIAKKHGGIEASCILHLFFTWYAGPLIHTTCPAGCFSSG